MKKTLTILLLLVVFLSKVNGQVIPDNYKLLVKLDIPKDLKWGIPSEIILDSVNNYFVIAFDYRPTYLDFYKLDSWEKINRLKLGWFTYLDNSYFDEKTNSFYIDKGWFRNNFVKVDAKTFDKKGISCKKTPRGCDNEKFVDTKTEYFGRTTLINNEWYIIKYDEAVIEVYLKEYYSL